MLTNEGIFISPLARNFIGRRGQRVKQDYAAALYPSTPQPLSQSPQAQVEVIAKPKKR